MRLIQQFWAAALSAGALAGASAGQARFDITVDYPPGQRGLFHGQSCTVRVFALFDPNDYAFAAARWNIDATDYGWSELRVMPPFTTGSRPGVINGGFIGEIIAGQIHFPPVAPADPVNPALVWQATWTAYIPSPAEVFVRTQTIRFDIYPEANSARSESRLAGFVEGSAVIHRIPSPGAALLLGLACLTRARRR